MTGAPRGGPTPIPPPGGFTGQLGYEQHRLRGIPASPEREAAVQAVNQLDAIAEIQGRQGDAAGLIGSVGKLGEVHDKVEAANKEGRYQLVEGYAEAAGTRFERAVTAAGTRQEDWPEAGRGEQDDLVDIGAAAARVDLSSLPGSVADGIRSIIRLQGQAEEHDAAAKHLEATGEVRKQLQESRTIIKNGFKEAGYYLMHLGPGVALGVIAGLLAGPLGAGAAIAIGGGAFALSELVGGITLYFNEKLHGLADQSNISRKNIEESRAKIDKIRVGVISGNINLVGALGALQEELWANAGFLDAAGNRIRDVQNDDRVKGAFNRTGGVPPKIRDSVAAFAGS